jgi:hypothetical protein
VVALFPTQNPCFAKIANIQVPTFISQNPYSSLVRERVWIAAHLGEIGFSTPSFGHRQWPAITDH